MKTLKFCKNCKSTADNQNCCAKPSKVEIKKGTRLIVEQKGSEVYAQVKNFYISPENAVWLFTDKGAVRLSAYIRHDIQINLLDSIEEILTNNN